MWCESVTMKCKPNTQAGFTNIGFCVYQQAESDFADI